MPEVFHICFVGMNKSTVYFSLAFIHVVGMFVVALSLHLSRERLCLRVHCLIDGILLFSVHTHLAFFFYTVAYCLCSRCRCTIHSVRLPHVSACPFLWATGSTEYFSFVSKRIVASVLFVVTPSSCCPYNVQSKRLLQVSVCAFLGRASTWMPTVDSSKFCFHIERFVCGPVVPVTFTGNVYPTCLSVCALLGPSLTRMPTIYISVLSSYTS